MITYSNIDASALIAYLEDSPGAEVVERVFRQAVQQDWQVGMSTVAYGEVCYVCLRALGAPGLEKFADALAQLPVDLVATDDNQAAAAAELMAHYNLAFSDACSAALAMRRGARLLTANPGLRALGTRLEIALLG